MSTLRWAWAIAASCIAVPLLRLWMTPIFPTQDGPSHLYNAMVLRSLLAEGAASPFAGWFRVQYDITSSWFAGALLMLLMEALPAAAAEKALLSIAVAGLPLAGAACARALGGGALAAPVAAALLAPFALNFSCAMGFHGFALSLPLWLWMVARWAKGGPPGWGTLGDIGAAFVLWLLHPVSFAAWGLCALALAGARVLSRGRCDRAACARCELARLSIVAALPAGLVLWFVMQHGGGEVRWLRTWPRLETLLLLKPVRTYTRIEGYVVMPLAWGAAGWLAWSAWRDARWRGPAAAAAALFACAALLPDRTATGSFLTVRLVTYPWLVAVAALAAGAKETALAKLPLGALATVLVHATAGYPVQRAASDTVAEYRGTAAAIPRNSTLLGFACSERGYRGKDAQDASERILSRAAGVATHLAAWAALDRRGILLTNYEAYQGHFPIVWQPARSPETHGISRERNGIRSVPPRTDIAAFEAATGTTVDYVLVSMRRPPRRDGRLPGELGDRDVQASLAEIEARYERIATTGGEIASTGALMHVLEVWRRRVP